MINLPLSSFYLDRITTPPFHRLTSKITAIFAGMILSASSFAITPVQTYYVPLEESTIQEILADLSPNEVSSTIETIVSIAVGFDGTVIHYDHAEDGYEGDLSTLPLAATTQIWGDGNGANGVAPGFPDDLLDSGDVIILQNPVPLPRVETDILFDGADKFITNAPVAVTRAAWAINPGTLLAGAIEVYPTNQWGTQFEAAIGENTADNDGMFELVTASYMASENNTTIDFDTDVDGVNDLQVILNEGETFFVPAASPFMVGVTGDSDKPVQVHAISGDIGATFESRWAILFPRDSWTNEYFVPVSTRTSNSDDSTAVFLYNPDGIDIDVSWETTSGLQPDVTVPAGGNARVTMPNGTGARFFTASEVFYAIVTVDSNADNPENGGQDSDSNNRDHDWGFTSIPPNLLSSQALVGFAPSIDPTVCAPGVSGPYICPSEAAGPGSPVWVMSVEPGGATVLVDLDADPTTGAAIDSSANQYDFAVTLAGLERAKVFDLNDNDMSGALLYTEDGTFISVAWGQDPESSVRGSPYLDAGTVIPPLPAFTILKDVNLDLVDPGGTLTYTITMTNTSRSPLPSVLLSDVLPPFTTYVANTSALDGLAFPDAGATPFPLDESGAHLVGPLYAGDSFVFTFDVMVNLDTPTGVDEANLCEGPQTSLLNLATATAVNFTASDDALSCVPPPPPPGGGEGCTPGYWKQKHHFDSWTTYTPNQQFSSVFEDAFTGKTLLQVLKQGGGGLKALGRHTVAALLNAASPDVDYDVADVIAQFNALYPANKQQYNALKNEFAEFNEQGCPLN